MSAFSNGYLRGFNFFDVLCIYLSLPCPQNHPEETLASLVAQMVNSLPAMLETWVRSLVGKIPLEKGVATHSSILAWRIPWTEETGGLRSVWSQRVRHD